MQKKVLVAAISLAAAAPYAAAQPQGASWWEWYGLADGGVEMVNAGRGNLTRIQSGQASTSRLGIRGEKPVDYGLKLLITFEEGFVLDTGNATTHGTNTSGGGIGTNTDAGSDTSDAKVFSRQAFVGLGGSWGSVTLGRQYTPIYYVANAADPFQLGTLGKLTNTWTYPTRSDSSIIYKTPKLGPVDASILYSTGQENNTEVDTGATPKDAGRDWIGNVMYEARGLWIGAGHGRRNGLTAVAPASDVQKQRTTALGASYQFGITKLFASFNAHKRDQSGLTGQPSRDERTWGIGANVKVGPKGTFKASYASRNDKLGDTRDNNLFAVGYNHDLDRRTDLYVSLAKITNKECATCTNGRLDQAGTTGALTPVAGYDPRGISFGVRARF